MWANDPGMAKKWAEETPDMAKLPEKSKKNEARVSIPRHVFQRIVTEEVVAMMRAGALREADEDGDEEKQDPKLASADGEKREAGSPDQAKPKSLPKGGGKQPDAQKPPQKKSAAPEVPDEPDPADDDIEPDGEAEDGGGELNDELAGKTIQSISLEPKSKVVAGAAEVVLTFNETTDPLKILVTKTGAVKFFYRGALHNMP
jgi:hypothetical protein